MARPRSGHLHRTKQGQWVVKFMLSGERFTEPLGQGARTAARSRAAGFPFSPEP